MTKIPIPTNTEAVIDPKTGHMRPSWRQFFDRWRKQFADAEDNLAGRPVTTQKAWAPWLVEAPEDKDYPVIIDCPEGLTITKVAAKTTAGTATVTIKINGTPLGGDPTSASTSTSSEEHSTDNVVAEGDEVTITVSDVSDAEGLTVVVSGTQELATQ